ncbi:hypothetical protein EYC80_010050 [Monilinia laxa]|uniref:Major facilitator superfamily (MFS) profile domain-containing protein n=1 Tax=Monilinia laxa TaxID=61186 RepID=A0A5N6JTA2_MONLA|nr:hypothetical protein EYC80_010050 [Monilinia laxa]
MIRDIQNTSDIEPNNEPPTNTAVVEEPTSEMQYRGWHFWAIMTSMAVLSLLAGLDATAVSTAMPSIIKDFGTSQGFAWIANAYLLTTTAFTPVFGQAADIFGRRAMTLISILVFAVGSAVSGPAPNLGALITGRAVQGIGCAGINTMVELVVCDLVPLRERGKFMGFIFGIYAISTTIGPLIGGVFSTRVTWRWIFYLNLPLSGLTLAMVIASLGALPKGSKVSLPSLKRIDITGNAILIAAVTSILIALTWGGGQEPWSSWRTIVPLTLGLVGIFVFLLFESKTSEPSTPLRLFANRTSLVGLWCAFIHNMLIFWILFILPIYFQAVLRGSAFRSGVNILPTAAVCMPFTIMSGAIMTKIGRYRPLLIIGFTIFPIAFGLFTMLDQNSSTGHWVGFQIIAALAIGIIMPVTLQTILTPLAEAEVATATATWAFMRGFGTIWGAAIPLSVFNSRFDSLLVARLHDDETTRSLLEKGGAYTLGAGGYLYSALGLDDNPSLEATIRGIYVDSLKLCWQVGLAFASLGFLLTFFAKEMPMRTELETEFGLTGESTKKSNGAIGEEKSEDETGK